MRVDALDGGADGVEHGAGAAPAAADEADFHARQVVAGSGMDVRDSQGGNGAGDRDGRTLDKTASRHFVVRWMVRHVHLDLALAQE